MPAARRFALAAAFAAAGLPTAARTADMPTPPVAQTRAHAVKAPFGATRNDEYYWLRDDTRKDPAVLGYLDAENQYADAVLASSAKLRDKLYEEIVGRIKQDDSSVPYRLRGYWYYSRYEAGKDYPVVARRKDSRRRRRKSCWTKTRWPTATISSRWGESEVSQDNRLLAWAGDTVGRRQYVLKSRTSPAAACSRTRCQRRGQHRLGRRQPVAVLRREGPGHAAVQAREEARARHAAHAGHPGLRGAGRELLHVGCRAPATTSSSASTWTPPPAPRCAARGRHAG